MQVCIAVYIKPLAVGNNSWLRAFWRVCKRQVYKKKRFYNKCWGLVDIRIHKVPYFI